APRRRVDLQTPEEALGRSPPVRPLGLAEPAVVVHAEAPVEPEVAAVCSRAQPVQMPDFVAQLRAPGHPGVCACSARRFEGEHRLAHAHSSAGKRGRWATSAFAAACKTTGKSGRMSCTRMR